MDKVLIKKVYNAQQLIRLLEDEIDLVIKDKAVVTRQ